MQIGSVGAAAGSWRDPFWRSCWHHRYLVWQLTRREVAARYRGSAFGMLWALLTPLSMLAVYTFVFGYVFKARWSTVPGQDGLAEFALTLFTGQVLFQLFADTIIRAPGLIVGVPSYVKRVVFPLEVLLLPVVASAIFHYLVACGILLFFLCWVHGGIPWTAVLLPVVVVPVVLLALGLGWLLSSLGVYFRDIGQGIGIVMQVLLFATPVFYPISAFSGHYYGRLLLYLNPLAFPLEGARQVLVWGVMPDWLTVAGGTVLAALVAQFGYVWFSKTKRGFADVL